jgi:MFS family permease
LYGIKLKLFRRWLIFILAGAMFFLSQFYRASVAVIAPNLIQDLDLDAWELSTVSASFFYAFALMQIPVGIFLDSIGPRITMTLLTLVAAAGAWIFSMGESYTALSIGRVVLGIGMACNFMGTLKLITIWFNPRQFATLSAVVLSAGTAGNIAAATPLVIMVQQMGWRNSFATMAGLTFFMALAFFFLVRDRLDNKIIQGQQHSSPPKVKDTLKRARILFVRRDFWVISFATFCRYGIYASVQALWAGPYLMRIIGLSPIMTGNILLLMSLGLIAGSPFSGYMSDRILKSRKKVVVSGLCGMALVLLVLVFLPKEAGKMTLSALFFCFGLFSSSGQVMYAHIKEQVPLENSGMAMTAINFFTMLGVAFFLQGMGSFMNFLYPETSLGAQAFKGAFMFCSLILILIGVIYTLTTETLVPDPPKA